MCGRYSLQTTRIDLARFLGIPESELPEMPPRWNIAPSQPVPIVRVRRDGDAQHPEVAVVVWGLIPFWANDPRIGHRHINARRETLATKPAFQDSFLNRRCLVPADGFYEWAPIDPADPDGPRLPHYIRLKSGEPFTFAGLWSRWRSPDGERVETCTIVTGPPNELVAGLHDRMPVILPEEARRAWLEPSERRPKHLLGLLDVFPADALEQYPVSRQVNSPELDDASLIAPLTDVEAELAPTRKRPRRTRAPRRAAPPNLDLFGPAPGGSKREDGP